MASCAYLEKSDEAYAVGNDGERTPIDVHLCTWADGNPARFLNAPRWLTYRALAGEPVRPEVDCVGCPGYRPTGDTDNGR